MCMRFYNCDWHTSSEKLMQEWLYRVKEREKIIGKKLNEIECCMIAENLAKDYWLRDPIMFLKFSFYNMYRALLDPHSYLFFIDLKNCLHSWSFFLSFFNYLYFFILFGFFCFVLFSILNTCFFCCLIKVFPFISIFIFITLATGFSRVRLPIEPFLIILSMNFWLELFRRNKSVV